MGECHCDNFSGGLLSCHWKDLAVTVWSSGQAGELLLFSFSWITDTVDTDRFCRVTKVEGMPQRKKKGYIMYNLDINQNV